MARGSMFMRETKTVNKEKLWNHLFLICNFLCVFMENTMISLRIHYFCQGFINVQMMSRVHVNATLPRLWQGLTEGTRWVFTR